MIPSWEQTPTDDNLDAYTNALKLSEYTMGACKPKQKKSKSGNLYESNKHIPMRFSELGKELMNLSIMIGALVLEANTAWYVGGNLNEVDRGNNYDERIKLEKQAIGLTCRMEHIVRVINEHRPFDDNTFTYWIHLIKKTREGIVAWRDSEISKRKGCGL